MSHFGYDAAGRVECSAIRMNSFEFFNPAVGACSPTPIGGHGPDRIVRIVYDALGRPSSVTRGYGQPETTSESVTYTADGLPENLTDGGGNVSTVVYDGFDRPRFLYYPNATGGGISATDYEETTYDPNGNVTSFRDRSGAMFGATYDALNRPLMSGAPAVPERAFTYDNLDRLTRLTAGGSTSWDLRWAYDALGRRTSELNPLGFLTSQYDLAGRRTRLTWPDGFRAEYQRYVTGELSAVVVNDGAVALTATVYGLDNLGRRSAVSRGGGVLTLYGYDAVSRLEALVHQGTSDGRDVAVYFTHNPAGQIVTRSVSNPAYDVSRPFSYTAFAHNGLNRVTAVNGSPAGYADGRGNLTSILGRTYAYDPENNLTSAAGPTGTSTYGDDPLSRLWSASGPTPSWFQHDGDQLAAETDAGSYAVRSRHVPGDGLNEIVVSYSGPSATGPVWPLTDERGSVLAGVDVFGVAGTPTVYDDYGLVQSGPLSRFGYTGQVNLLSDLQDFHARAYQPLLGRFLQTDPIGYAGGMNLYGYVGGDPLNLVDPLGLSPDDRQCKSPEDEDCSSGDEAVVRGVTVSACRAGFVRRYRGGGCELAGAVSISFGSFSTQVRGIVNGVGALVQTVLRPAPHEFRIQVYTRCSPSSAYNIFRQRGRSAPGAPYAQFGRNRRTLFGGYPISQSVGIGGYHIENTTLEGHIFHSGSVDIVFTPVSGGGSFIDIVGIGSGRAPEVNLAIGLGFFGRSAHEVAAACQAMAAGGPTGPLR